jgi:hypothetical protein
MRTLGFKRYALSCVAIALLAGCGGSQPPIGAPGAMTQTAATDAQEAKNGSDLLYVAGSGAAYVFSYPKVKLLATIPNTGSRDACSDTDGNVFLTSGNAALEFKHGGTTPIATLQVPGQADGCAVDPNNNSLAVVFRPNSGSNDVAVFAGESGTPTLYSSNLTDNIQFDGYDGSSNLFVAGYNEYGSVLAELPSGSSSFSSLTISPTVKGLPGRIQWDGSYLTLEAGQGEENPPGGLQIDRIAVSGTTATVISTTTLKSIPGGATASWIDGDSIIVPYGRTPRTLQNIGIWKYPKGGSRSETHKKPAGGKALLLAATISVSE